MKVAVVMLGFDAERGEFDAEALDRWQADKGVTDRGAVEVMRMRERKEGVEARRGCPGVKPSNG